MQRTVIDGRYTLGEPLGGGGMAEVYLAHDEVLDRDVAIKILRGQYAGDDEFVERFRREAQSAARLSHPNIVQIFDRGRSEDGSYYIAMEHVPRGTLKDRILRDGPLPPDTAAAVALQISDALQVAHDSGVVHRDIKPQNVLVTQSGDVKVTDFGIARAASSPMTATSTVLGTAAYMSPEQALGRQVGPASDLYSLGIVLYEMLTGALPYTAESPIATAMKHVNEPPRSPREVNPEVPDALDALVLKLLAKKPEDRYASAAELADDLERIRSGLPPIAAAGAASAETEVMTTPLAPPPGATARTQRTSVRRPPVVPPARMPGRGGGGSRVRSTLIPLALFGLVLLGALAYALTGATGGQEASDTKDEPAKEEEKAAKEQTSPADSVDAADANAPASTPGNVQSGGAQNNAQVVPVAQEEQATPAPPAPAPPAPAPSAPAQQAAPAPQQQAAPAPQQQASPAAAQPKKARDPEAIQERREENKEARQEAREDQRDDE